MIKNFYNSTDEELLLALADGHAQALDLLYQRHSGRVLSYSKKKGLSAEQAEDVLQIVFLQLYRKKHLYNPKYRALAWIYVISRSEVKDYRNREIKNHDSWDESLSQTNDFTPTLEVSQEADHLLAHLKDKEQEILKMRFLSEMEYGEIAEILQEKESNIRQIVSRSLRSLKKIAIGKGGNS